IIPPATAKDAAGHTYESNSVAIQVVNGSLAHQRPAPPGFDPFDDPFEAMMQQRRQAMQQRRQQQQQRQQPQNQQPEPIEDMNDVYRNLFIKVSVDKNKAYVGEQITASYKLY